MDNVTLRKVDKCVITIDKKIIKKNFMDLKSKLPSNNKIMAIVKSNAYGHGLIQFSKVLEEYGVDHLAVSEVKDGVEIRKAGVKIPILIFGQNTDRVLIEKAVKNSLTLTVYSFENALNISNLCMKANMKASIQIKIDTGMNRYGITCTPEGRRIIKEICGLPYLNISGVYSHLSSPIKFKAAKQIKIFENEISTLKKYLPPVFDIHILNSAGIENSLYHLSNFNIVRPGNLIYGIHLNREYNLALSFYSTIDYLKDVEEGAEIGYGGTYIAAKKMKIATIPCGFYEGIPSSLSNNGRVIINNQYATIIGKICMNACLVDVTEIKDVKQGDIVIFLGKSEEKEISLKEWEENTKRGCTDLLTNFNAFIPRAYIE